VQSIKAKVISKIIARTHRHTHAHVRTTALSGPPKWLAGLTMWITAASYMLD